MPGDPVQNLQATFKRARGGNCALDGKPFDEVRLYEGGCFQVTKRALPVIPAVEPKAEDPKAEEPKEANVEIAKVEEKADSVAAVAA